MWRWQFCVHTLKQQFNQKYSTWLKNNNHFQFNALNMHCITDNLYLLRELLRHEAISVFMSKRALLK